MAAPTPARAAGEVLGHVHREPVRDKEWKADEMEIRLDDRTASAAETRALGVEVGDLIAWTPHGRH